jgi:hypothetical protein
MSEAKSSEIVSLPVLVGHWTPPVITPTGTIIEQQNMFVESYGFKIDPRNVLAVHVVRPESIGKVFGELEERGSQIVPVGANTIVTTGDGEFHYTSETLDGALQQIGRFKRAGAEFAIPLSSPLAQLIMAAEENGRSVVDGRPGVKIIDLRL